jgi:broad specificity phosphatase PhoE
MKKTIVVMRHSHKGPDGELTKEGELLAKKVGDHFKHLYPFGWAISSPEARAIETVRFVTRENCPVQTAEEVGIPQKELGTILRLFGKLGNASLARYIAEGTDVEKKLCDYGQTAWNTILRAPTNADNILVVGHEVLIGAIGAVATSFDEDIVNSSFNECEGFILTLNEKNCAIETRILKN